MAQISSESLQTYPWLSQQIADTLALFDEDVAIHLKWKKHPARKASEEVSKIAKEKRELQKQNKMQQYQLSYYEHLFPWLEEFKQVNPRDGWKYIYEITDLEESEYEALKEWISPEEYKKLPSDEKYQLVLDRYVSRNKTDLEIGIDYERYIGYLYEAEGYKVYYSGALLGLEDMGRDLVAEKGDNALVIQCKRWSQNKTIHEKHIFQLFGTTILLQIKNPRKRYSSVFITTTSLSDVAKDCAKRLGIDVKENFHTKNYPMIKCNIGQKGEKIYHLPVDQQYDKVQISNKAGALFVKTVKEAEAQGFRRAYRWRPTPVK